MSEQEEQDSALPATSDDARLPAAIENPEDQALHPVPPGGRESGHAVLPIVGIGASAGGLKALGEFFDAMPADSGLAFVVVQHLSPHAQSLLPDLLSRHTTMEMCQVEEGTLAAPNEVYVIPPDHDLVIETGVFQLSRGMDRRSCTCLSTAFSAPWPSVWARQPSASSCPGPVPTVRWACDRSRSTVAWPRRGGPGARGRPYPRRVQGSHGRNRMGARRGIAGAADARRRDSAGVPEPDPERRRGHAWWRHGDPAHESRRDAWCPNGPLPAAHIEVQDAGEGMPAEVQARMFEPFFTTKPGGSGLGLYACHRIVSDHGGEIEVHSRQGAGTTVTLWLPLDAGSQVRLQP